MKTLTKLLGFAALVVAMPIFATAASAAEARQPDTAAVSLNGAATAASIGILAKSTAKPQTIVVAGRRGRRVGAAIVGGVIAGALIAGAARAHDREYYYGRRYRHRCERWLWKCDEGYRYACRKFYRYCE